MEVKSITQNLRLTFKKSMCPSGHAFRSFVIFDQEKIVLDKYLIVRWKITPFREVKDKKRYISVKYFHSFCDLIYPTEI